MGPARCRSLPGTPSDPVLAKKLHVRSGPSTTDKRIGLEHAAAELGVSVRSEERLEAWAAEGTEGAG